MAETAFLDVREHPVQQEIDLIIVDGFIDSPAHEQWRVGERGVTLIEQCTKSGMHSNIAYVRVWRGNVAVAEFCQHQILAVYFKGWTDG